MNDQVSQRPDSRQIVDFIWAAWEGNVAGIASFLDLYPFAIDTQDTNGDTALTMAAWRLQGQVVKLLIARGADPTVANADGFTAADFAREQGSPEMAEFIEDAIHECAEKDRHRTAAAVAILKARAPQKNPFQR